MTTAEPSLAPLRPFAGPRGADALALAHFLREAVAAGTVREALHLRLGTLTEGMRRTHHHRLVRDALAPLMRPTRARVFELPNGDVVAIAPPEGRHLGEVQEALGILFAAEGPMPFTRRRLPEEAAALLAAVEESLTSSPATPRWPVPEEERPPISAADLVALERGLGHASLARFLVRRPVCRLAPGESGPETEWEDWSLDWTELCATLLPGADTALAPALFRRLRRLADRRLLSELARPEDARRLGRAGLSLAPETVAEAEFLRLDAALGPERRERMTVCFAAGDALANPAGFAFARDFCRLRGWRVALDLAAPALLPGLPLAGLQVDLLRLRWSAALPGFAAALPEDRAAVVLAGADRAAAIGWGWEAGITLFEGRLLRPRG